MTRRVPSPESPEQEIARLRAELEGLRSRAAREAGNERREVEALRQSELKYRRLHESLRDAFVFVDMAGRIRESNEAYQRMLGYEPEELRELTYQQLTPARWHAVEADIIERQVMTRGHSDVYEKEYRRKDGHVLPIELRTVLMRDAAGAPSGMWAIVRDISERKRAEQALRESASWLGSALDIAALGLYR